MERREWVNYKLMAVIRLAEGELNFDELCEGAAERNDISIEDVVRAVLYEIPYHEAEYGLRREEATRWFDIITPEERLHFANRVLPTSAIRSPTFGPPNF